MSIKFDSPITTSDQSIDRVLNAGLPVILLFINGPLDSGLAQAMDRLALRYSGQILVVKASAKDSPGSVERFQVNHFPAVLAIRNALLVTKSEGISGSDLEKHALYLLGKGPKPEQVQTTTGNDHGNSASTWSGSADAQAGQPRAVTDATFEQEVLRSPEPVLVDFWAPWCGPCRIVEPIVKKIAQESTGRLRVAKVNVDENPLVAERYNVRGIPMMMVVKDGKVVDQWTGALPEPALRNKVKPYLNR